MGEEEEARAYLIAQELIEEHGDAVGAWLERKIDECRAARDWEQHGAWFVIRNAVTITLLHGRTSH